MLTLVFVPAVTFALTIEPASLYPDVRASTPEAAGINMLSREGIVQGYASGLFGFGRQINRAEFLKIAMKSTLQGDGGFAPRNCFPDVTVSDWFSPFVCAAQEKGIVSGKAIDGVAPISWLFDPAGTVTYGEALKMLTLIYGYDILPVERSDWAEPFYRAAVARHVDLPITIRFETPLTRSLAARLTAAFLAEKNGKLWELRLAEAGQYAHSSSSLSSSVAPSSSSVSSSSMSSSMQSSMSSSQVLFTPPPVSHFLVAGKSSDAIALVTLRSIGETARITSVQVKLANEVTAIDTLELVTAGTGDVVATLNRRTTTDTSDYKLTYETQIDLAHQKQIPADTDVPLVLRAKIRSIDNNGASEQLLQVRTFSVTIVGTSSTQTTNVPAQGPFPKHQTAFGRITDVRRVSPATAAIQTGSGLIASAFSISGTALAGKTLTLEQLEFSIFKSGSVILKDWKVRIGGSQTTLPCTVNLDQTRLTCPNLTAIGSLPADTPLLLEVLSTVSVPKNSTDSSFEIDFDQAGSPDTLGSLQWTDQSGHFRWVEGPTLLQRGTRFQ